MTCTEACDAMMIAEPAVLSGRTNADLTAHLESCAKCESLAALILSGTTELDAAVTQLVVAMPTASETLSLQGRARSIKVPHMYRYLATAATLACIAIGFTLLQQQKKMRLANDDYPLYIPPPAGIATAQVNTRANGAVAVIRTNNPKITVVWYLKPQRGKS